eukprot:8725497-Pyramimonas_sp.AAC.1
MAIAPTKNFTAPPVADAAGLERLVATARRMRSESSKGWALSMSFLWALARPMANLLAPGALRPQPELVDRDAPALIMLAVALAFVSSMTMLVLAFALWLKETSGLARLIHWKAKVGVGRRAPAMVSLWAMNGRCVLD